MPDRGLPDGWRLVRLGEVATIVMGQAPPGSTVLDWNGDNPGEGLPFIQGNAEFGGSHPRPIKWCRQPAKIAEAGDTLISVRAPVGEMNLADGRLAIGRGVAAIRFTRVEPRFGWHQLAIARAAFSRLAQGSTFTAINSADLTRLGLLIPPPDEQARIAEVLDAIDAAIEKTEAVIEATERLRAALLHELLARGVPGWHTEWKDVPGIGTIPACWQVDRLGEVCQIKYGTSTASTPERNGLPVLRIPNVARGEVDLSDLKYAVVAGREAAEAETREGDLLVVRTNGNPKICGTLALVPRLPGRFLFASYLMRIRLAGGPIVPGFLAAFLNTTGRSQLRGRIRTSAGNYNISASGLASVEIAAPSVSEQERIVGTLDTLGARAAEERKGVDRLERVKAAVADALLSGRIRLRQALEIPND